MSRNIENLEKKIGYSFNDKVLAIQAITHSSYANEKKKLSLKDNERLEFLGDAVLELVSSNILFSRYPDMSEGKLTKLRAGLVCEPTLACDARAIELGEYLLLGKGEEASGGRKRDSVTSDALEALIGAIYLDGGLDEAYSFIEKFIINDIDNKKMFSDSKTYLQEVVAAMSVDNVISYEVVDETGPDHDKMYTAVVKLNDEVVGSGVGRSKKMAEQQAAYYALKTLDTGQ